MHASLRQKVLRGTGLKTVVLAASMTKKGNRNSRPLVILLDSGADDDIIFLPEEEVSNYDCTSLAYPNVWTTSNGSFETKEVANLNILLPEYSQSKIMSCAADVKRVKNKKAVKYDAIIGIKTLHAWKVNMDFENKELRIDGLTRPMRSKDAFLEQNLMNIYNEATEPHSTREETARVQKILDAKYEAADLEKIVEENCSHLTRMQRLQLLNLLRKHESMFSGELGEWKNETVHFELKPNAKPYRGRPFPIPQIHRATIMKEIERLIQIGVLEQVEQADWLSPSFIIPKSDRTVRFLSDFRELNKALVRRPFPLPKISDMLQQMEGFTFATAIDLNMGYYHLKLDVETMKICAIVFPWGIYRYKRLPMGVACSPDIFQSKMSSLFAELSYVQAYLDDLLCLTKGDFDDHMEKLDIVLQRLRDAGLQVNAAKSKFAAQEIDYLEIISRKKASHRRRLKSLQSLLSNHLAMSKNFDVASVLFNTTVTCGCLEHIFSLLSLILWGNVELPSDLLRRNLSGAGSQSTKKLLMRLRRSSPETLSWLIPTSAKNLLSSLTQVRGSSAG